MPAWHLPDKNHTLQGGAMKKHRVIPYLMLVVLVAGILAGCGGTAATPAAQEPAQEPAATEPATAPTEPAAEPAGGTLVIAMNLDDVVTLDPAYAGETTNLFIHINTYDTLVDIRPDDLNTIVPRLAESWEVNDFTEFIFHLRQDAKFASGNRSLRRMLCSRGTV
jgi:peptide/nickel transport system substrate-binding protein